MKYFTLFSLFFISFTLQAQAPRGFYLSAGLTSASLESDHLLGDPAMGFKGGLNFNFGYHETYNYQIEVMSSFNNVDLLAVNRDYERVGNKKFDYTTVDIGFYFNYYLLKPEEDKFFLGAQIGATAAFSGSFAEKGSDSEEEYYLPYLMRSEDFEDMPFIAFYPGIGLTGGYNDFRFDLRYSVGLTNILSGSETNNFDEFNRYTGPELDAKMNIISFTLSYRLNKLFGFQ